MLEHMYHKPLLKEEELLATLHEYRDMVAPYVGDVSLFLDQAIKDGKRILLEGQLGTLKDPDHGIYPMVTSSSTLAAYGAIGAGIPPYEIKKIVTVCKAYSSTAENSAQRQVVRDVWDGSTVWQASTAAVCREQPTLHLPCSMYWDT